MLQPWTGLKTLPCVGTSQCPLFPCPLFPYLQGRVLPWGPYSVLSSSAISSCGMPKTENLVLGDAPFPPLCHVGSVASHSQIPTQGQVESILQSSSICSARPEHQNSGWTQALCPTSLFPYTHAPPPPHTSSNNTTPAPQAIPPKATFKLL